MKASPTRLHPLLTKTLWARGREEILPVSRSGSAAPCRGASTSSILVTGALGASFNARTRGLHPRDGGWIPLTSTNLVTGANGGVMRRHFGYLIETLPSAEVDNLRIMLDQMPDNFAYVTIQPGWSSFAKAWPGETYVSFFFGRERYGPTSFWKVHIRVNRKNLRSPGILDRIANMADRLFVRYIAQTREADEEAGVCTNCMGQCGPFWGAEVS